MAERRMFSKRIVETAKFLRLPQSAQILYFYLGLEADDEGMVEAFKVLRIAGCTEDDLRALEEKGYVKILNEELISYLPDWDENNKIRSDRKTESFYKEWLAIAKTDCQPTDNQMLQNGNQVPTDCQPTDNQMLQNDNTGKDRIGKDRIGKDTTTTPLPPSSTQSQSGGRKKENAYTFYENNIHPVCGELEAELLTTLISECGEEIVKYAIKEAVRNNARKMSYIATVAKNKLNGIDLKAKPSNAFEEALARLGSDDNADKGNGNGNSQEAIQSG